MRVAQQFGRDAAHQPVLDRARRGARRDADAIAEAEDVRINRHRAFAERHVQHDIGGLAADTRQLLQCFAVTRHLAAVLFDQLARQFDDIACLALPEPDRADMLCHAIDAETQHRLRRGGFLVQRPVARFTEASVACAESTTATSSVKGSTNVSSLRGSGLALASASRKPRTSSRVMARGLRCLRLGGAEPLRHDDGLSRSSCRGGQGCAVGAAALHRPMSR